MKPRHTAYTYGGGQEQCLCFGPQDASRRILMLLPLFDEMNRMRRTAVQAMRSAAHAGIATCLPDLPGCNESTAPLALQNLHFWRSAVAASARMFGATHIMSVRGGCLIDSAPDLPVLRMAPVKGSSLIKTLVRTQIASDKESGIISTADSLAQQALSRTVLLAGNEIAAHLWSDLDSAVPEQRPDSEELALADIGGSALWLRAEPQYDPAMAKAWAQALDEWSARA